MSKPRPESPPCRGCLYLRGKYTVRDIGESERAEHGDVAWQKTSIDWSSNFDDRSYYVWAGEHGGRILLRPYDAYPKAEYEELFGGRSGREMNMEAVVEMVRGAESLRA